MSITDGELGRREFLKKAAQAAAAAALTAGVASGATSEERQIGLGDTLPSRVLGKTGVRLPILGYGGGVLPKEWGNPLSLEDRVQLVRYAYDQGVRYFDTAGSYLESQKILGEALKDVRDNVCLATKVETPVPGEVRRAVEKSLEELQTDYLDIIQIHGTPGLEHMSVSQAMKIHGELAKLRDERIGRLIGVSAHSYFDKALALISSGEFDHCMLAYGYLPKGLNQLFSPRMLELRNACLAKAHELGMCIVAMKVLSAGVLGGSAGRIVRGFDEKRLGQLPGAAIRYVLQDKRVHILTIGMRFKKEVDANIAVLSGDATYTPDDRALLTEFCAEAYESERFKRMRLD
ncbi:MAG: aldo/keto reductase [Planctomycetota bacterium]|jgi:predicted aldo/keto reductase-like oxidoreductase